MAIKQVPQNACVVVRRHIGPFSTTEFLNVPVQPIREEFCQHQWDVIDCDQLPGDIAVRVARSDPEGNRMIANHYSNAVAGTKVPD
jgi:hypothetical protein